MSVNISICSTSNTWIINYNNHTGCADIVKPTRHTDVPTDPQWSADRQPHSGHTDEPGVPDGHATGGHNSGRLQRSTGGSTAADEPTTAVHGDHTEYTGRTATGGVTDRYGATKMAFPFLPYSQSYQYNLPRMTSLSSTGGWMTSYMIVVLRLSPTSPNLSLKPNRLRLIGSKFEIN